MTLVTFPFFAGPPLRRGETHVQRDAEVIDLTPRNYAPIVVGVTITIVLALYIIPATGL